jgi:hypothetical protein
MLGAGASRKQIASTLSAAYGQGLLSEQTFVSRLEELLAGNLIDPRRLVGDLNLRASAVDSRGTTSPLRRLHRRFASRPRRQDLLLALDWAGPPQELVLGRHRGCDVVLNEATVSRWHARLIFRDGAWILHDLGSTNGTAVNGLRVARCEVRPGDRLLIGGQLLEVD